MRGSKKVLRKYKKKKKVLSENKYTTYQNLWVTDKLVFTGKCIALSERGEKKDLNY